MPLLNILEYFLNYWMDINKNYCIRKEDILISGTEVKSLKTIARNFKDKIFFSLHVQYSSVRFINTEVV